ncbi:hypothetical protein SAMN04488007_3665 [Maribacter aquivivus]|uniref:Uncharacterized protein n=1 Tax=Maribacter aquivivus TaxID=228958 RepID=A0A1M6USJ6_9FLAO|nr:hypothetical protein [Maribacter aquivivus]SHK72185.1 hypothetical protein SAMN04488007_3665 [Maribacter aquivivus]
MATIPTPEVMQFKLDTGKLFKEVRHYNLVDGKEILSNKLNIGINRGFSKAKYIYSVKIRQPNKWSKQITGLYATHDIDLFYGDTINQKNLLIARFKDNGNELVIYYFEDFYPKPLGGFLNNFKG